MEILAGTLIVAVFAYLGYRLWQQDKRIDSLLDRVQARTWEDYQTHQFLKTDRTPTGVQVPTDEGLTDWESVRQE